MANAHLACPDMALYKLSGTDPEQDAEAFIRLKDWKINFSLGIEPNAADAEHVIYLFRKKLCFPRYYGDQQPNGMGALFKMQ